MRGGQIGCAVFLSGACLCIQSGAKAQTSNEQEVGLGLSPGTPQVGTLPGGIAPAYGAKAEDEQDYRFDFHGFVTMPLRLGINRRAGNVQPNQSSIVFHAPPMVPDERESFTHTGVVPEPYAQLAFSYGNSVVTGTVILLARTATTASSFFDPSLQSGISDAFVSFNIPDLAPSTHIEAHVGAFTNRYGFTGEYDEGRYGTPILGRTNGVGENIITRLGLGQFVLQVEQGIQGQLDWTPTGLVPDGWNGFAEPGVGTGLVHHEHLGLSYKGIATLGLHYLTAWTQDDRASQGLQPDGSITLFGADLRLSMGRFGYLYVGAARTEAERARSIGRIVEVLNAPGGAGLMRNYLGPYSGGSGELTTIAAEYDLSIARFLHYPRPFEGNAPDIVLSGFGMITNVTSRDPLFDGIQKRKIGGEAAYSFMRSMAVSLRVDRVDPNFEVASQGFTVISPRIFFRSNWQARDQVVLQYSRWFNGRNVVVRSGYPPIEDPSIEPDEHILSLSASTWW